MSKFSIKLYLSMIFLNILPIVISYEDINEKNESFTQSLNKSNEEYTYPPQDDPFKDFDFGNVIWLDDTNATSEIKKHEALFITFYSPYCPHCHKFLPEYVKIAKYAEEQNLKVKFAKIETLKSFNITEEFEIRKVPSIFLIYNNSKYLYEGEQTKEGLLKFLKRKENNDVFELYSLSELDEYINNSSFVLLSTLRRQEIVLHQSFLNYSKTAHNIDFVTCFADECVKKYLQNIILFKKFDEKVNKYFPEVGNLADAHPDSVKEFVATYGVETGANLSAQEINMMFEHNRTMLFYFRNSSLEEHTKYDKMIKELGKDLRKKKVYTVLADIEGDNINQNVASNFRVINQDLPCILFYDLRKGKNKEEDMVLIYSLRPAKIEQLNKKYLEEYIDNIKNGKILSDLYSEPPLKNYTRGGLRIVIGRTFDKEIYEEKNNVLLTLIDTYCPICEKVLGLINNLTKKYPTEEKKLKYAYIDASRNQPRYITTFDEIPPIILLYTNAMKEKKIMRMNHRNFSEITEEDIEDFIYETLNWERKPGEKKGKNKNYEKVVYKEKKEEIKIEKEENKEEKKEKKETKEEKEEKHNKKDTQTDL